MKRLLASALVLLLGTLAWAETPFWWQAPAGPAYQVLVYSFADSNGDGTGDLRGLTHRLGALQDLGVTALWLSPIHPSASYHGYDVKDYRAVSPALGTLGDFDALVKEAHARGIRVLLDMVFNHTSIQHPWFKAHPDWYANKKPGVAYGSGSMGGWVNRADGSAYYATFTGDMPDLDVTNPAVVAEFKAILKFWLDRGVDGFRFDAAKEILNTGKVEQGFPVTAKTKAWWNALRDYARSLNPAVYFIGEVSTTSNVETAAYAGAFDGLFDFVQAKAVKEISPSGNAPKLASSLETNYRLYRRTEGFVISPFLANHDQDRAMSATLSTFDAPAAWGAGANINDVDALGQAKAKAVVRYKGASFLEFTLPGLPYLYYGEELGLAGQRYKNDDVARRDAFPWGDDDPEGDTVTWTRDSNMLQPDQNRGTPTWADQSADPDSLLSWYKSLGTLKKDHPALRSLDFAVCPWPGANGGTVVSFFRTGGGEKLLASVNLGWAPASFTAPAGTSLKPVFASGTAPEAGTDGTVVLGPGQTVLWALAD